jgi:pimeloyl-ACP methyl ester carboxylesterase
MPIAEFDDHQLHYRDHGSGDPVIGIMGFAIDQRFWAAQVPAISATNRFITFDNRGIGRSTGTPPDSIEQMAEDTLGLMDKLDIEDAVIFGVSMGGTIAQKIALEHPERVKALILAVTFARPIEYMRREQSVAKAIFDKADFDTFLDGSLIHLFSPAFFEIGEETIDRMVRAFYAEGGPEPAGTDVLTAQLDAIEKFDVLPELGRIEVPTLVIGATLDMMVPYFASQEIARAIPNARLETLEGGHGVMVEQMQRFNDLVEEFLEEVNDG